MARSLRIQYPGATYHVMDRGHRREEIVLDDDDRREFLRTLGEACERTGWLIHSYVLMPNHYHFVLETPEPNLSVGMHWFQGTYTARFKARHQLVGHVFQGRFKSPIIERADPSYFVTACNYVHLNPARAGLLKGNRPRLSDYPWSSYPQFLRNPQSMPLWLQSDRLFANLYGSGDCESARERYRQSMETKVRNLLGGRGEDLEEQWQPLRRGWYIGSESFKEELAREHLRENLAGKRRDSFRGDEKRLHDEQRATDLLERGCAAMGLDLETVKRLPKSEEKKMALTWLVKTNTMVTNEWISRELGMGSRTNIANAVRLFAGNSTRIRQAKRRVLKVLDDWTD